MSNVRMTMVRWWALLVLGTAAALLITWLADLAGVPLRDLLVIAAGAIALGWLIVLVTVPWNLYFSARQVVAEMAISRERGITVLPAREAEAQRIAGKTLGIALAAHVATALAADAIAFAFSSAIGFYLAGLYLLSAAIRPAAAYLAHVHGRIKALTRESTHPREDVSTLREEFAQIASRVRDLDQRIERGYRDLADDIGHARKVLTADLARVQDAHAADREAARSASDTLARRVDAMVRRIDDTMAGLSDHQEIQAGLRALVRMIRADAAAP